MPINGSLRYFKPLWMCMYNCIFYRLACLAIYLKNTFDWISYLLYMRKCVAMYVDMLSSNGIWLNQLRLLLCRRGCSHIAPPFHHICLCMYSIRVPSNMRSVMNYYILVWTFKIEHNTFNALCCWLAWLIWYNNM